MTDAATQADKKTTEQRRAERLIKDISHIKPETVKALAEAGLVSLQDLLKASAERISQEGKVALDKAKDLKAEAEKLVQHVAQGAKTSEGRKKLAREGKDVAVKTAKTVEASARDLLQKAQKDGESAIAKAKELKDKAPATLQEYRQKAEAALKDAQKKVEELAKKTEEFAKHEIEKVRAANEGTFKRVKAKFNKD